MVSYDRGGLELALEGAIYPAARAAVPKISISRPLVEKHKAGHHTVFPLPKNPDRIVTGSFGTLYEFLRVRILCSAFTDKRPLSGRNSRFYDTQISR